MTVAQLRIHPRPIDEAPLHEKIVYVLYILAMRDGVKAYSTTAITQEIAAQDWWTSSGPNGMMTRRDWSDLNKQVGNRLAESEVSNTEGPKTNHMTFVLHSVVAGVNQWTLAEWEIKPLAKQGNIF